MGLKWTRFKVKLKNKMAAKEDGVSFEMSTISDLTLSQVMSAEEFHQGILDSDKRIKTLLEDCTFPSEAQQKRLTELLGIRTHLQDEIFQVERIMSESDPDLGSLESLTNSYEDTINYLKELNKKAKLLERAKRKNSVDLSEDDTMFWWDSGGIHEYPEEFSEIMSLDRFDDIGDDTIPVISFEDLKLRHAEEEETVTEKFSQIFLENPAELSKEDIDRLLENHLVTMQKLRVKQKHERDWLKQEEADAKMEARSKQRTQQFVNSIIDTESTEDLSQLGAYCRSPSPTLISQEYLSSSSDSFEEISEEELDTVPEDIKNHRQSLKEKLWSQRSTLTPRELQKMLHDYKTQELGRRKSSEARRRNDEDRISLMLAARRKRSNLSSSSSKDDEEDCDSRSEFELEEPIRNKSTLKKWESVESLSGGFYEELSTLRESQDFTKDKLDYMLLRFIEDYERKKEQEAKMIDKVKNLDEEYKHNTVQEMLNQNKEQTKQLKSYQQQQKELHVENVQKRLKEAILKKEKTEKIKAESEEDDYDFELPRKVAETS